MRYSKPIKKVYFSSMSCSTSLASRRKVLERATQQFVCCLRNIPNIFDMLEGKKTSLLSIHIWEVMQFSCICTWTDNKREKTWCLCPLVIQSSLPIIFKKGHFFFNLESVPWIKEKTANLFYSILPLHSFFIKEQIVNFTTTRKALF